jgi:hypothetical protein
MSDPYPDVTGDESGIVPPQSGRHPDWPKKIRTLTASELDRLTIDSSGRFYWDGKLVNYEPPQNKPSEHAEAKRAEPLDPSALEILDRAAYELGRNRAPEPADGATPSSHDDPTAERRARAADLSAVDLDVQRPVEPTSQTAADASAENQAAVPAIAPRFQVPERVRIKLSFWQSLGAFIAVLGIAVGASGLAAYGLVAAHDWGCRVGVVKDYCPSTPAARPVRPDIPA